MTSQYMIEGVGVFTLAEMLGDPPEVPGDFLEQETALEMPRLEGTAPEPALGIHFGMPDEVYHALPCLSNSGLRALLASPTLFWDKSWLNPDREQEDREHQIVGRAYHAMILEGPRAYRERFAVAPDPADYPKALRSADEIKDAIKKLDHKPVTRVDDPDRPGETRAARKEDHVAQLVALDRSAVVWDDIVARAQREAGGRAFLSADDDRRIRIAARMISQDPQLVKAFRGGFPEVTLIWRDPRQGVLMKARTDYLKLKAVVDLKSFANKRELSVRATILRAIAENRYCLQPATYLQGVDEVRKLVRQFGASAVHFHNVSAPPEDASEEERRVYVEAISPALEFAFRWAQYTGPESWLWVFQQKGNAPVTRGLYHPLAGSVHSIAGSLVTEGVRKFRECVETYGTDPWLDLAEVDEIHESEIPTWGLEI